MSTSIGGIGDSQLDGQVHGWAVRSLHSLQTTEPLRTKDAILSLLAAQDGRCPVCEEGLLVPPNAPDELTGVVERHPQTDAVRALLCRRCHDAMALFGADPRILGRAARYSESLTHGSIEGAA
jgi:hypothetical protein